MLKKKGFKFLGHTCSHTWPPWLAEMPFAAIQYIYKFDSVAYVCSKFGGKGMYQVSNFWEAKSAVKSSYIRSTLFANALQTHDTEKKI